MCFFFWNYLKWNINIVNVKVYVLILYNELVVYGNNIDVNERYVV